MENTKSSEMSMDKGKAWHWHLAKTFFEKPSWKYALPGKLNHN